MGVTLATVTTLAHAQSFHEWHGGGLRGEAGARGAPDRWYGERASPGLPAARGLHAPRGGDAQRAGRAPRRADGRSGGYGIYSRYDAPAGYPGYGSAYGGYVNGAPPSANYRFGEGESREDWRQMPRQSPDPAQRAGSIREDVTRYNEEHGAPRSVPRGGGPYRPMPSTSYRN